MAIVFWLGGWGLLSESLFVLLNYIRIGGFILWFCSSASGGPDPWAVFICVDFLGGKSCGRTCSVCVKYKHAWLIAANSISTCLSTGPCHEVPASKAAIHYSDHVVGWSISPKIGSGPKPTRQYPILLPRYTNVVGQAGPCLCKNVWCPKHFCLRMGRFGQCLLVSSSWEFRDLPQHVIRVSATIRKSACAQDLVR